MLSPPSREHARYGVVCLLAVAAAATVAATSLPTAATAATDGASPQSATATQAECFDADYDPPDLAPDWSATFTDGLSTESLDRWTGGRVAPVGAGGDCSLFVAGGERATLSAATVDGSGGVVAGTLDLGANGSLRLVDAGGESTAAGTETDATTAAGTPAGTSVTTAATDTGTAGPSPTATRSAVTATADSTVTTDRAATTARSGTADSTTTATDGDAPAVAIENRGPDFSTEAVVAVGNRSRSVTLPSGRFFEFAVARTAGGEVRVAVWDPGQPWDGEWDATFDSVPETEWRVRLDGRAFLDGIAVGVGDRLTPTAEPPVVGGDDTPTPTEDPLPNFPDEGPDSGFEDPESERSGNSAFGSTLVGLVVVAVGAVMVRYAYGISRFSEQLDAIGSTTPAHEVEPAAWNVALTKIGGGLVIAFGLYLIVSGFL
ncbi:hypothetical protein [Halosimplex marinum]|uniref:hypothetical protein n=1 Tax=Halosimplex marinum TaxID=3396620 RepID=UPI003F57DB5B